MSSSCTWRIMRAPSSRSPRPASTCSMARFMTSAAVPCTGMLTATRSAEERAWKLLDLISGMKRRRPSSVSA